MIPTIAQVYAEFNTLHERALREGPRSPRYLALLEQMEMIVADVRTAVRRSR